MRGKGKKINREFGFLSYTTPDEAASAIRWMHGACIEGLTKDSDGLTVQYEAQGTSKGGALRGGAAHAGLLQQQLQLQQYLQAQALQQQQHLQQVQGLSMAGALPPAGLPMALGLPPQQPQLPPRLAPGQQQQAAMVAAAQQLMAAAAAGAGTSPPVV